MNACRCGQEARFVEDRAENGQKHRFCSTCGNPPPPRTPMTLDDAMIQGYRWIEDALIRPRRSQ